MGNKHVYFCDVCNLTVDVVGEYQSFSGMVYKRPKHWIYAGDKEVCSKKCANIAIKESKTLPEIPYCSCCENHKDNK